MNWSFTFPKFTTQYRVVVVQPKELKHATYAYWYNWPGYLTRTVTPQYP